MTTRFPAIHNSSGVTARHSSRAWSRRDRDFSYSTLVGSEEFTTIQTYFADDTGCTFQALSPFESECKRQGGVGAISAAIRSEDDVPRVEGKARHFRRHARKQIAVAMARARNGWIHFMYKLSGMKRHGKLVALPKHF